ncbi:MAG: hypothetical protein ACOY40_05960 [Bacillota bacterium]
MMWGNWGFGIPAFGLLMVLVMAAFYVIVLVAFWRLMRAHESIAENLKHLSINLKEKPKEP